MKTLLKNLASRYVMLWAGLVLHERRPRIVAVTGSVGKTTTKEAIAAVLMHPDATPIVGLVGKSPGTLNTEFGVPLAVLRYSEAPASPIAWLRVVLGIPFRALALMSVEIYPSVLVLEFAADRPGDIRRLACFAPPEVGVVTAVGPAHLELFRTIEGVAKEKGQLIRAVRPSGLAIVARDNSHTAALTALTQATVRKIPGRGMTLAKGIATAVGEYFHVPDTVSTAALNNFVSLSGRLQTETIGSLTVIDDTYNANPLSMELGLDTMVETAKPRQRKVAFLGEMKELGDASEHYHREIGLYARSRADVVIGVGKLAEFYTADRWFATSHDAAKAVLEIVHRGDCVFVKGSHSVKMEQIVTALRAQQKELRAND